MVKNFKNKIVATVSIAAVFFAGITTTNAQEQEKIVNRNLEFGFRLMPTITSFNAKTSDGGTISGNAVLGLGFGALIGVNISNHFGVEAEVIYSAISRKSKDNNQERKVNLRYINVPVMLSFNTGKTKIVNLNIIAGPQIGFNVGSSMTTSGTNNNNDPQPVLYVKKNDVGFAYGAGLDFALNEQRNLRLGIGYRGVLGLIDVSDNSQSTSTNSYYIFDRTHINTNSAYVGLSVLF